MTARDPLSLEKLFDGDDWRSIDCERTLSFNQAYERANRQWTARNEGEANQQMQGFKPPFTKHEEIEQEWLTPGRVLAGCGIALALADLVAWLVLR